MNRYLLLLASAWFVGCAGHGQLKFVADLPSSLDENSGIAMFNDSTVWLIEDKGNGDNIYKVNHKGEIIQKLEVKNAKNGDWEDLATNSNGNLYIGDFGNNDNNRKNLTIYKLPNPETEPGDKIDAKKIKFRYPEQKDFPAKKEDRVFDAEAFFHYGQNLYIFTKNDGNPFTGETSIYRVIDKKGKQDAKLVGRLNICLDWNTCRITSADISPNGKTIVLLGYGKLWRLTDFTLNDFSGVTIEEFDLGIRTQLESVCFSDNDTLFLSDEKRGNEGGNLYSLVLP
ncbi:hypothetical protein FGM00_00285 [Aggregatimonas sangjinii]|uniref:SdiA-regulated family protein n=1 Tax=Aggregatimonas sangjinii TaxID=2583587 RepID=A0A5B7SNR7_9FLAO|nr:hypothetical protein [Aggregatimonas sangjinii]QCW98632.1 hypothetical protein FGM00_00285 [Aggregatimonas sangjinii]